jgi:uncharacterized membrane protein
MSRIRKLLKQHKYKVGVFVMLGASSAVCIGLVAVRMAHSGSERYSVQIWNLFLAWIPFLLAFCVHMLSWRRGVLYFVLPVFIVPWVVFFPNAQYLLTDLEHLNIDSIVAPLWYDVVLLVWFTWTGMLLGVAALNLMQDVVRRTFTRAVGWIFVFVMAGCSSAGVYIGRFIRLNSTDVFQDPAGAAGNIWGWLADPSRSSLGFVMLYTLFFIFVYLILYMFGNMSQDHQPGEKGRWETE